MLNGLTVLLVLRTIVICPEMEDYELGQVIGYGSFSTVYKAESKMGDIVAIKIATIEEEAHADDGEDRVLAYDRRRIEREIELWKPLDHGNLCRLLDVFVCETEQKVYFVMEYAESGDLLTLLDKNTISIRAVKEYFKQMCQVVLYLHKEGLVHGDIKLENILINSNDRVKLSDFGLARKANESLYQTNCGTVEYAAPELLRGDCNDLFKADIWALGVVLYALLYHQFPFDGPNYKVLKMRILTNEPAYKEIEGAEELVELTKMFLDKQAERRPSIDSVLNDLE